MQFRMLKEEGRRKKEEGRRKKEEGRRKKEENNPNQLTITNYRLPRNGKDSRKSTGGNTSRYVLKT
ncbi:hypothetical protein [Microcoleus vaginatus]|uniref:hypothetical protein n=1 Tax=Microcoleus vaginatus TaxID=119532 RepID=UPI001F612122